MEIVDPTKMMAREWGQFLETMTKTEHKAAMYDSKESEVVKLRKEVADL